MAVMQKCFIPDDRACATIFLMTKGSRGEATMVVCCARAAHLEIKWASPCHITLARAHQTCTRRSRPMREGGPSRALSEFDEQRRNTPSNKGLASSRREERAPSDVPPRAHLPTRSSLACPAQERPETALPGCFERRPRSYRKKNLQENPRS